MLRALAFISVWQQKHKCRLLSPFGPRCGHKLVDQNLSAVGKVSELRLPQDQDLGRMNGVTKLEANRRRLRERTVVDRKRRPGGRQCLQWFPGRTSRRIVENEVSLREGAPF